MGTAEGVSEEVQGSGTPGGGIGVQPVDIGTLWGWEEEDGVPKEYGDTKGGVRTPEEVWGEVWGAGTPSEDVGVQPMGYSSPLELGRGVWGPQEECGDGGVQGDQRELWGPQRGGVGMEPKGCGEVGVKRWVWGPQKGVREEMGCKDPLEGRMGVVCGGESQREGHGEKGGDRRAAERGCHHPPQAERWDLWWPQDTWGCRV